MGPMASWPVASAVAIAVVVVTTAAAPMTTEPDVPLGDRRTDDAGIDQVYVPAGCFEMGTDDADAAAAAALDAPSWAIDRITSEQPAHEVCLSSGYWIDATEVTNAAYDAFVTDGGYTSTAWWSPEGLAWLKGRDLDRLPATCGANTEPDVPRACVTWYEAEAYAAWRGGILPTEAQWEFAARGPESLVYPWGDDWDTTMANVLDATEATSVGSYPGAVSWVGASDMSGNVMEWVADWLSDGDEPGSATDPSGPETGGVKIEKGGWFGSNPVVARAAYRHFEDPPDYQDHHIGFRIVEVANAS